MTYKEKLDSLTEEERRELKTYGDDLGLLYLVDDGGYNTKWNHFQTIQAGMRIKLDEILSRRTPPKPVFDWWKPDPDGQYFYLNMYGSVRDDGVYRGYPGDGYAAEFGNCFPSGAAADAESLRTTARRFYEHCCRIANGGSLWPDGHQNNRIYFPNQHGDAPNIMSLRDARAFAIAGVNHMPIMQRIQAAMIEKNLLTAYFEE